MHKKLLILAILLGSLTLNGGCASIGEVPVQEGVDLVWLKQGQKFTAPIDGAFLSKNFHKFSFERCK